jgi:hypothetical protein
MTMVSNDEKIALINQYLERFYGILKNRPLMIGKPDQLNTVLYYLDHLSYIAKHGEDFTQELSWVTFLSDKKYLQGDHDILADQLKDSSDLRLFTELRAEYAAWFKAKTGRELTTVNDVQ